MAINIFNADNLDSEAANEKMEQWLDDLRPFYLNSPEYKKLSKANKKAQGDWFDNFMFFYLNYIGNDIKELDVEAAKEITLELYPGQMLCSDSQAKTIIPELIAYWQFLHRELNQDKKQLKHVQSVISFLQSIRKNYLQLFKKQESDTLCEGSFEALMKVICKDDDAKGSFDGREWLTELISDAASNLTQYKSQPSLPEHWAQLRELPLAALLIDHTCRSGIDDALPNAQEAVFELVTCASQEIFMQIRQGDKGAISCWHEIEQTIIRSAKEGTLNLVGANILFTVLTNHKQFLSAEFIDCIQHWNMENTLALATEELTPEAIEESTRRMLEEIPDEFILISVLNEQLAFLPTEGLELISRVLMSSHKGTNSIVLMALDSNPQRAQAVVRVLSQNPQCLPSVSLARLICIRNWLAKPVQKDVDKLIQAARKKGIVPRSPQPLDPRDILETRMTAVDGSGSQGVMLIVRDGSFYRLISFVLKESVGIIDVMVSPQARKPEVQKYASILKKQTNTAEKIAVELIHELLPFFLACNLKSGIAIDPELIQAMELIGAENWNPNTASLSQLYDELLTKLPTKEEITAIQKRSLRWTSSALGESWFEEPAEHISVQQINSYSAFFEAVVEPARLKWGERLGRMALWAYYCTNKNRHKQYRDYVVVSWLLEHSDMPSGDISLLGAITRNSL